MRPVIVLHHRWFYNPSVIFAYVIVTIWQKCLFYVHAGAQNGAQFPEGICVCSFVWCCGNLCHCQYWQGNCYDVSKSLWPSESKVVRRVHMFSCSNWLHAVYIKHEMYCGGGFICRWLSAVKAGSTFFSGSKLVHAWCFETILITNCYIFGSNYYLCPMYPKD